MISVFNKKAIAVTALALSLIVVVGCSSKSSKSNANSNGTSSEASNSKSENKAEENKGSSNSGTEVSDNNSSESSNESNNTSENNQTSPNDNVEANIAEKVKEYILNGQEGKIEAEKIKWSKTFLDKVDIDSLYKQYIDNGGSANDIVSFANYITENAPIPGNWQELFEKDLLDTYGEKVVRIEQLDGDMYQAYVEKDGTEVPYVAVSSRTGYFHG